MNNTWASFNLVMGITNLILCIAGVVIWLNIRVDVFLMLAVLNGIAAVLATIERHKTNKTKKEN